MNQEMLTRLEENLSLLRSLEGNYNHVDVESKSSAFFEFAFDLLLLIECELQLKQDAAFLKFLADGAPFIEYLSFGNYISELREILMVAFESDEWLDVCYLRSRLESVRDLYGEVADKVLKEYVGKSIIDLDESISIIKTTEGYLKEGERPEGVPKSHWWWY